MRRRNNWKLWTWWNARADARRNLPSPETQVLGDTERQIQTGVNLAIRYLEKTYAVKLRPLESELSRLKNAHAEIYEPEYRLLQEITGRRDVRISLGPFSHVVLLFLLTMGEMAFNLVAFNVFREPALYTALMALAVVISIPLCAWAVGLWLRQWQPPWWKTGAKIVLVSGILVAVLWGVNRIRLSYLQQLAPEFMAAHPELNAAFLVVNIVILVGAALVTYLAHDPQPGFAEAKRKAERVNVLVHRLDGKVNRLVSDCEARAEMAKESGWQLIAYYRMVNRRRRSSAPHYFDDPADTNYKPEFVDAKLGAEQNEPVPARDEEAYVR